MINKTKFNTGQTLIETVVAAFVLTMGITAAVGLAIYVYGTSTNITKQIVAVGLAREGIEAVKFMRDTNWLDQASINTTCYNYESGVNDGNCYLNWLNQKYCINPDNAGGVCIGGGAIQNFNLSFEASLANWWNLNPVATNLFGLSEDKTGAAGKGYYFASNTNHGSAGYYRKIIIQKNTSAPFNQNLGPELQVTSQVWWTDKKCPRTENFPGLGKCSVEMKTYLTNWKNY